MSYPPPRCVVWELTLACNMRCQYCGSAAGRKRERELDTAEALHLCDELHELGVGKVSLMGGEPLLRPDWPAIVGRFQQLDHPVEIISNGLLIDRTTAFRLRELDVYGLSLSIDGTAVIHDRLRRLPGSFERLSEAVENAQEAGLRVGIVTQINKDNLPDLEALYQTLVSWQIDGWQLQLTGPLGAAKGKDCTIRERDVVWLHEWGVAKQQQNALHLYFADDIGYFHPEEPSLRAGQGEPSCWLGCQAGLDALGIASDGSVRGCLSLPEEFTEDSVRNRPLRAIWEDPALFSYNRQGHELAGDCARCAFAKVCRGGCKSFGYATMGHLGQMAHCWHRLRNLPAS
jgi:radical SAM protein with 4Fe4S-binding SPASM domain